MWLKPFYDLVPVYFSSFILCYYSSLHGLPVVPGSPYMCAYVLGISLDMTSSEKPFLACSGV